MLFPPPPPPPPPAAAAAAAPVRLVGFFFVGRLRCLSR